MKALAALLCLAAPAAAAPDPGIGIEIEITHLRSAKGMLQLCLAGEAQAFPDCRKGHGVKRTIPANAPSIRLTGLAPGHYALAVIHDENANAKLDTFAGIPREGFGFSRNPAIGFGPPSFAKAEFSVVAGAPAQQVRMRYLL